MKGRQDLKLLYITSLSGKRINGFMRSALIAGKAVGFDITMACNMDMADKELYEEDCRNYGFRAVHINFNRNPLSKKNIEAYRQLNVLMNEEKFDIVHCNTPIGGVLGRICALKNKIPTVIYQAHGFHFWKGAPLKNWILYYPVERLLAHYTDVLITINNEDYIQANTFKLRKNGKIVKVPGVGVNLNGFTNIGRDKKTIRSNLGLNNECFYLITVGRLVPSKNIRTIIKAFKQADMLDSKLLICGDGQQKEELKELIHRERLDEQVILLGFREDIAELLQASDVFVFPTLREGLPGALMEAMSVGMPCVASKIRGNVDLLGENYEYLIEPKNTEKWAFALKQIQTDSKSYKEYMNQRIKEFSIENAIDHYKNIYHSLED